MRILEHTKPTYTGHSWRSPRLSGRKLAEVRKTMIANGYYWPEKPLRDRGTCTPPKLHKHERTKEER